MAWRWDHAVDLPQVAVRLVDVVLPIITFVFNMGFEHGVDTVDKPLFAGCLRDLAGNVGSEDTDKRRATGLPGVLVELERYQPWKDDVYLRRCLAPNIYPTLGHWEEEDDDVKWWQANARIDARYVIGESILLLLGSEGRIWMVNAPKRHDSGSLGAVRFREWTSPGFVFVA